MRLEDVAAHAQAILSQRRKVLDDVITIAAYAQDSSRLLKKGGLTELRGVDNVCHLRFMALLYALVRENGKQEFSPRTTISTPASNLAM